MVAQVALVPIYLTHWNVVTYGVWLSIQALVSLITILDFGHQEFLSYEFLRIGKDNRLTLSTCLWSGISSGIIISLIQLLLIIFFVNSSALPALLGESTHLDPALIRATKYVLFLQGVSWLICSSVTGLLFRVLVPFGYYPRMAWWNLFSSIVSIIPPLIAVILGADLLITGIVAACTGLTLSVFIYIDLFRVLRREKISFSFPSWQLASRNFFQSLAITGKILLEMARGHGIRLIMAPLSGAAGLVAFSTMRTGANVALQGVKTITNPLMPELMRFLNQRDQDRVDVAFGIVWIIVVALMAPAVVLLQAFVEPLYMLWTRGKIPFDPLLFALLSLGVLVYAVAQPAMAVVIGNNLLKPQLVISTLGAGVAIVGLSILVPVVGILGGGIALLIAEIVATIGYWIVARRWLHGMGLSWPERSFIVAITSVCIAAVSMGFMIWLSQITWLILALSMLLLGWNFQRYWLILPDLATQRAKKLIIGLPVIKGLYHA
ncbi:hypothetical protein GCM10027423_20750 [Spirosoma arcticum]